VNRPQHLSPAEALRLEWLKEGEFEGHTPGQTIAYLDIMADLADEQAGGSIPDNVISVDFERRGFLGGWLRRRHRG
jgi:hypothetical protein